MGSRLTSNMKKHEDGLGGSECELNIDLLPDEVLLHIFHFLPIKVLLNVREVCWRWQNLAECEYLWKQVDLKFNINTYKDAYLWSILERAPVLRNLEFYSFYAHHLAKALYYLLPEVKQKRITRLVLKDVEIVEIGLTKILYLLVDRIQELHLRSIDFIRNSEVVDLIAGGLSKLEALYNDPPPSPQHGVDLAWGELIDAFEPFTTDSLVKLLQDHIQLSEKMNSNLKKLAVDAECEEKLQDIDTLLGILPALESLFVSFYTMKQVYVKWENRHFSSLEVRVNDDDNKYSINLEACLNICSAITAFNSVQDFTVVVSNSLMINVSSLRYLKRFPNLTKLSIIHSCSENSHSFVCVDNQKVDSAYSFPSFLSIKVVFVRGCSAFVNFCTDSLKKPFERAKIVTEVVDVLDKSGS